MDFNQDPVYIRAKRTKRSGFDNAGELWLRKGKVYEVIRVGYIDVTVIGEHGKEVTVTSPQESHAMFAEWSPRPVWNSWVHSNTAHLGRRVRAS